MRVVLQRVSRANVAVDSNVVGEIGQGLLVLLGVGQDDTVEDCRYLVEKITNLRIFSDEQGKMNVSVKEIEGEVLVISQFTLYGDCRKGRRPNFGLAGSPDRAKELYEQFIQLVGDNVAVQSGVFQAHMQIALINDGPVTMWLDSKER